ncbi:hypothetical protein vBBaMIFTN2_30 [Bordetella phage vB_BaM-IFTN2]|nr:hypothetical protein vBBaMIFTN2_30 [Bordetella phage vB_BaM-IFTN2]
MRAESCSLSSGQIRRDLLRLRGLSNANFVIEDTDDHAAP